MPPRSAALWEEAGQPPAVHEWHDVVLGGPDHESGTVEARQAIYDAPTGWGTPNGAAAF